MKVLFNITDETTITSKTVKIIAEISGQVGNNSKSDIDVIIKKLAQQFIPDVDWAFSNFQYTNANMIYKIQMSCRIPAEQNEKLSEKADSISSNLTSVRIVNIDNSIPLMDIKEGERRLRGRMLKTAIEEATTLAGKLSKIEFFDDGRNSIIKSSSSANYAMASREDSSAIHQSEKISLTAALDIEIENN